MAKEAALTLCMPSGFQERQNNQADHRESLCKPQALKERLEYFL